MYGEQDFILSGNRLHDFTGSGLSFADEVLNLPIKNVISSLKGEETNIKSGAVRLIKGITPAANLWYTKAVTDHMIFNQLQEWANPNYLKRMEQRAKKQGSSYWWRPSDVLP